MILSRRAHNDPYCWNGGAEWELGNRASIVGQQFGYACILFLDGGNGGRRVDTGALGMALDCILLSFPHFHGHECVCLGDRSTDVFQVVVDRLDLMPQVPFFSFCWSLSVVWDCWNL